MNASRPNWWELVEPETLARFVDLHDQLRGLGRRPRSLLVLGQREDLRKIENELDQVVELIRPAAAAARADGDAAVAWVEQLAASVGATVEGGVP